MVDDKQSTDAVRAERPILSEESSDSTVISDAGPVGMNLDVESDEHVSIASVVAESYI